MKKIIFYVLMLITILLLPACMRHNRDNFDNIDNTPPSPPTGLVIMNGDNRVDLSWNQNLERDVQGYNVYWAKNYNGPYYSLGSTSNNYFTDYGAVNGVKYYYAVTAYDFNGNESDYSVQNVSATPRPEGFNVYLIDNNTSSSNSGFSFNSYTVVPSNAPTIDFYYENDNGTPFINLRSGNLIQDLGPTRDIYDIPYAPTTGWTNATSAVGIIGHTYVIWTYDNYYAKIRISNITNSRLYFDWAFQTVAGNTQLKISNIPSTRGSVQSKSLIKN